MICLNMIVKNEAHCIERCLRSVQSKICDYVILDTGSTDATRDAILATLGEMTGAIYESDWSGFGPTRTRATEWASRYLDEGGEISGAFLLFIDADETLDGALPPAADLEGVDVVYCRGIGPGGSGCNRTLLARASIPWKFEPITHETIMPVDGRKLRELDWTGCVIRQHDDSARQRSGNKAAEDIAQLTEWLRERPNDTRAQFYLARSYRFGGDDASALPEYLKRSAMPGGDPQERVISWFDVGKIHSISGRNAEAQAAYMNAYRADPFRAEPLVAIASLCIDARDFTGAEFAARQACALRRPEWRLFDEVGAYDWIRWDLLTQALIALGGAGRLDEAREIFRAHPMPASEAERYAVVAKHLGFSGEDARVTVPDLTV